MKFISRQKFLLFSFLILTGNCLLGYAIYHSNQELLKSEEWVRHTEQVIAQTINIFSTAKDIKINSRDFALTNDTAFVRSLNISGSTVFSELDKLKQLTVDNPAQQKRIDSLRFFMHKRLDFALKIVSSRIKNGLIIADINSSAQNDKYYTTPILKITDAIQQVEKKLLEQRKEANKKNEKVFNRLSVLVFLLMAGFTILLLYMIRKYLKQNDEKGKRAAELVIANAELSFQNDEKEKRADELVIANKELYYQNQEKEKRAVELAFANGELIFQSDVRKIAEKNLLKSESRLKEAQAISKIGNFEADAINETEVWSDEMYNIYGINKTKVTPSKELFLSFIHPDDQEEVIEAMKKSTDTFDTFAAEFRFFRSDGALRYGHSEARFDWNSDKELIRIYGIIQDVTDRKLADIERKKMVNDLMARNNDLEQFAYIISHNLRAPVANIIGASTALNDIDVSDEEKEILNNAINTSVMKLDDVVQDLNHILQVKSNINETKETVSFTDLVEDIKTSIQNLVIRGGVSIKCDFSEFNDFLTIKSYMYSIFYNLITNSVKYCQTHSPCEIQIQSLIVKNTLQLIFTDNGLGINLEKKGDQIFGLYKRFHENTEGKGMGLYMVKTQVEILGGKISIKSEENVGTEFIIEFILND
jgi:PAS domain S-box-containing protein